MNNKHIEANIADYEVSDVHDASHKRVSPELHTRKIF